MMKPLIFATLAMCSLSVPVMAQPEHQNGSATVQTDTNLQGNVAGPHTSQTSGGDVTNPAPHIYKRGEHLSRSYGAFDVVDDWSQFHLTKPAQDSHWVKYGDNYLLVKISSGEITDIVKAS